MHGYKPAEIAFKQVVLHPCAPSLDLPGVLTDDGVEAATDEFVMDWELATKIVKDRLKR